MFACMQSVTGLSDQLGEFKEYIGKLKVAVGEEKSNNILSNSLFLVVAGSDDLANTYYTIGIRRLQYDISSYADFLAASASTFLQVTNILFLPNNLYIFLLLFYYKSCIMHDNEWLNYVNLFNKFHSYICLKCLSLFFMMLIHKNFYAQVRTGAFWPNIDQSLI